MSEIKQISKAQKTKIHIAKQQMNLKDQDYRDILSGFKNDKGSPCASCIEFNFDQANVLLEIFRRLGWKEKRNYRNSKYSQYAGRDNKFASVGQMELIDRRWYGNPGIREKNDIALNHFLKRIAGVDHISFLLKKDVSKIIKAVESIKGSGNDKN